MAHALTSSVHTPSHNQRPSLYVDIPFTVRVSPSHSRIGTRRCILRFVGRHCRTVVCNCCALCFDFDISISQILMYFRRCLRSIRVGSKAATCLCGRTLLFTLCRCWSVISYKVCFLSIHAPAIYATWKRCMGYELRGRCFLAAVEQTPLVSDAVTDIHSPFFSNWFHYECSMGTRQGRCLRLAVCSTR